MGNLVNSNNYMPVFDSSPDGRQGIIEARGTSFGPEGLSLI